MTINQFKILHSETLMFYQIIENDLKIIFAFMHCGNPNYNYNIVDNKSLGQIIKELKELDFSDGKSLISSSDYNFLSQITQNRNHWAHQTYINFIYNDNYIESQEYNKECVKLSKDHDRAQSVCQSLEKIRLDYCKCVQR